MQDFVHQPYPRGSEYPNSRVLGPQNPYSEWFWDFETLLFGYLDPEGILNLDP